jgi:3-oxoadipate enol-lactonase
MTGRIRPAATDTTRRRHLTGYLNVTGSGPTAPARTLLLLHAFPLAAEMWQPQLSTVPPGWRFIAPDLRGFGQSPPSGPSVLASMDDHAEDVVALLDHLELDRAVVGGLSMGGYVAFALLRLAPERVAGLVLADTRPEADDDTARANRDRMTETLEHGGAAAVIERLLPNLLGATTRTSKPDVVRQVRELALAQSDEGIRHGIQSLKSRRDSTPLLAGIRCPALVVVGDEDQITNVDVARALHGRISGAELVVLKGAGHLSNLEQPGEFNQALSRFLAARF